MLHVYSDDQFGAIFLIEIAGIGIQDLSIYLQMSANTVFIFHFQEYLITVNCSCKTFVFLPIRIPSFFPCRNYYKDLVFLNLKSTALLF